MTIFGGKNAIRSRNWAMHDYILAIIVGSRNIPSKTPGEKKNWKETESHDKNYINCLLRDTITMQLSAHKSVRWLWEQQG